MSVPTRLPRRSGRPAPRRSEFDQARGDRQRRPIRVADEVARPSCGSAGTTSSSSRSIRRTVFEVVSAAAAPGCPARGCPVGLRRLGAGRRRRRSSSTARWPGCTAPARPQWPTLAPQRCLPIFPGPPAGRRRAESPHAVSASDPPVSRRRRPRPARRCPGALPVRCGALGDQSGQAVGALHRTKRRMVTAENTYRGRLIATAALSWPAELEVQMAAAAQRVIPPGYYASGRAGTGPQRRPLPPAGSRKHAQNKRTRHESQALTTSSSAPARRAACWPTASISSTRLDASALGGWPAGSPPCRRR